jgi:hypothetical protein
MSCTGCCWSDPTPVSWRRRLEKAVYCELCGWSIRRCAAGETFLANLDSITVELMCATAEKAHVLDDEKASGEFAI